MAANVRAGGDAGHLGATTDRLHFAALDSLRGVCAVLVVLFHFHVQGAIYSLPIVQNGWMFVDFFFVLSGFVVSHAYAERLATKSVGLPRFMALRLGRIYPLHFFMLVVLIALEVARTVGIGNQRAGFDAGHSPLSIVTNLLLLQCFGLHDGLTWNGAAWSIAAEVWSYLIFAIVMILKPKWAFAIFAVLACSSLTILLAFSPRGLDATSDFGFFRALLGFSIGLLARAAYGAGIRPSGTLIELTLLVTTGLLVARYNLGTGPFALLPVFGLVVVVFASERGVASAVLRSRLPRWLGTISYSIYMIHTLPQLAGFEFMKRASSLGFRFGAGKFGDEIAAPPIVGDLMVLMTLGVTVVLAGITYRLIEVPARNWVKRVLERSARTAN